jgi:hypothetical protein
MKRMHCDICDALIDDAALETNHDMDLTLAPDSVFQANLIITLPSHLAGHAPDICAGCWDAVQDAIDNRRIGARVIREAAS